MRPRNHLLILVVLVAAIGATAGTEVQAQDPTQADSTTLAELEVLYQERLDRSRAQFTQADVDFMAGMIAHHAQALIMSDLVPDRGNDPQVQTLASRIINAQQDEIETMQKWLRDRDQPVPEVHIDGLNLMIHGVDGHGHHDHVMPGMLTQEQLEELDAASGDEFDRLFLDYMIGHHSGAIVMVDELFSNDGAGQDEEAFKLASDINVDQTTEIARMELMLESLSDEENDS